MLGTPGVKWSGNSFGFSSMPLAHFGQKIDMNSKDPLMQILDREVFGKWPLVETIATSQSFPFVLVMRVSNV